MGKTCRRHNSYEFFHGDLKIHRVAEEKQKTGWMAFFLSSFMDAHLSFFGPGFCPGQTNHHLLRTYVPELCSWLWPRQSLSLALMPSCPAPVLALPALMALAQFWALLQTQGPADDGPLGGLPPTPFGCSCLCLLLWQQTRPPNSHCPSWGPRGHQLY